MDIARSTLLFFVKYNRGLSRLSGISFLEFNKNYRVYFAYDFLGFIVGGVHMID